MRRLTCTILVCFFVMWTSGCTDTPVESQQCPKLSYAIGSIYTLATEVRFGDTVSGELPTSASTGFSQYAGHPLAVPAAGGLTIRVTLTLDDTKKVPAVYLYGARDGDGVFGGCQAQVSEFGVDPVITFEVPEGQGGEYLVLVGANPIAEASGGYTLTVACEGDGCEGATCPSLLGNGCDTEVCPTGFVTTEAVSDSGTLTCATCECRQQQCGAFRRLVYDTCVCDCPVALNPKPVCGVDGNTYESECFANCHQVSVANLDGACTDVCATPETCDLDCPNGLKYVDGCRICECAASCNGVTTIYQPVCGTDGLTHTNPARLRCETAGSDTDVSVAYLGACLPHCGVPNCNLSCEHGYRPNSGVGDECFECRCMEPVTECTAIGSNGANRPYWCGRRGPISSVVGQPASYLEQLSGQRTFVDRCSTDIEGWKPVYGDACPTGTCQDEVACAGAEILLKTTLTFAGFDADNVFASDRFKFGCLSPDFSAVSVCAAAVKRGCKLDSDCPSDATCDAGSGRCEFGCACLNSPSGFVYDPVCSRTKSGERHTFYNACLAFCFGAWPMDYPGMCCDERRTVEQRKQELSEITGFCEAKGDGWQARIRVETACPPTLQDCQQAENEELCCVKRTP
ncbi:MAG: hypothetical protein ACI9OJ_000232 [Myxococcota bacterium]|jgi:hypothetical protein